MELVMVRLKGFSTIFMWSLIFLLLCWRSPSYFSLVLTQDILIDCGKAITSINLNPIMPYHLGVGCEDSTVRVFDRRALSSSSTNKMNGMFCQFRPDSLNGRTCRVTSLHYRCENCLSANQVCWKMLCCSCVWLNTLVTRYSVFYLLAHLWPQSRDYPYVSNV